MKKIFITFITLTMATYAEIPAVAFKDVTKYFKDPHYSPLMGRVALDSGFIYNLRHFGPFDPAYGKDSNGTERRLYDSDTPYDAMMALLLKFFPSSAGPLASESIATTNFGKKATIEDVAMMLKFAKEVRDIVSKSPYLQNDPNNNWGLSNILKKYEFLGPLRALINQSIQLEYNASKKEGRHSRHQRLWKEGVHSKQKMTERIETEYQSEDDNSLYPLYTTEQIILAFFVHHFNSKDDITKLMQLLGGDFVDAIADHTIMKHASLGGATRHDIEAQIMWNKNNIPTYQNKSDLDYLFFNTYYDINAPIPFTKDVTPISNGNCPRIKIDSLGEKEIDNSQEPFADCQETSIRQLFSIGFYDEKTKSFKIPETIQNPHLTKFFQTQTPIRTNDNTPEIRGLWNMVIGGIPDVRYRQGINEIDAGYINVIKAMRHILGIANQPLPTNKDDVIQLLKDLFKTMNPELKSIEINIPNFTSQKDGFQQTDDEFYGDASIQITNAYDQTFQFTLRENPGHSDIQRPTWENVSVTLPSAHSTDDIMVDMIDKRLEKKGLYKLLAVQEFCDERQRIWRVRCFENEVKSQHISIINRLMDLKVNDQYNINNAGEAILPIVKKDFIFDNAFNIAVKSLNTDLLTVLLTKDKDKILLSFKKEISNNITADSIEAIIILKQAGVYISGWDILSLLQAGLTSEQANTLLILQQAGLFIHVSDIPRLFQAGLTAGKANLLKEPIAILKQAGVGISGGYIPSLLQAGLTEEKANNLKEPIAILQQAGVTIEGSDIRSLLQAGLTIETANALKEPISILKQAWVPIFSSDIPSLIQAGITSDQANALLILKRAGVDIFGSNIPGLLRAGITVEKANTVAILAWAGVSISGYDIPELLRAGLTEEKANAVAILAWAGVYIEKSDIPRLLQAGLTSEQARNFISSHPNLKETSDLLDYLRNIKEDADRKN